MPTRSLKLDIFAEDRQPVLAAIRRYRACARHLYGLCAMAQSAGASIEEKKGDIRVKPNNNKAKLILASACDGAFAIEKGEKVKGQGQAYSVRIGSGFCYELRPLFFTLWPTAKAFVWDSLRRDLSTVWTARDPQFPQASRGWLTLQGARKLAQFNWRGIGFPIATAQPKFSPHAIRLHWDRDIGPVELSIGSIDPARAEILRSLVDRDEGWSIGTIFLNERDGRLHAAVSYDCPVRSAVLRPERIIEVRFASELESFLRLVGPGGLYDSASAESAAAYLARLAARSSAIGRRKAACGSPRQPWGVRKGNRAERDLWRAVTEQRERVAADWNHAWSRRIIARAETWRCGTVRFTERPADLFGHPWKWAQLLEFARYKGEESGVTIITEEVPAHA